MPERPEFEALYREFLPRIYGYCLAQLRSAAEAEDVTAQVFIKAYQAYDRFEPQAATPAAWLFRIARNAILDFHRRAGVHERAVEAAGRELSEGEDPSRLAEDRVLFGDLLEAVRKLPEWQR